MNTEIEYENYTALNIISPDAIWCLSLKFARLCEFGYR